jgi:hypothetical protein
VRSSRRSGPGYRGSRSPATPRNRRGPSAPRASSAAAARRSRRRGRSYGRYAPDLADRADGRTAGGVFAVSGCSSPATEADVHPDRQRKVAAPREDGHVPSYRVRPGEHLAITVAVTVPRQLTVTELWFGISTGVVGGGSNGTGSMHPILARYRQTLPAGAHMHRRRMTIRRQSGGGVLHLPPECPSPYLSLPYQLGSSMAVTAVPTMSTTVLALLSQGLTASTPLMLPPRPTTPPSG